MSAHVEQFATRFDALNAEVITTVERCTDDEWRRICEREQWSVAVVAHHIATVNGDFISLIQRFVAGETFSPPGGMEDVHRSNAQHARDYAAVGKPETLALLRENEATLATQLRKLDDEDLDRVAGVFGGRELTVAQVVEWVVIGHTNEHLASIHATLGD